MMFIPDTGALPDRVVIKAAGQNEELSITEFLRLPLSQRIRCMVERTATFYAGELELDRLQSLDNLRKVRAKV